MSVVVFLNKKLNMENIRTSRGNFLKMSNESMWATRKQLNQHVSLGVDIYGVSDLFCTIKLKQTSQLWWTVITASWFCWKICKLTNFCVCGSIINLHFMAVGSCSYGSVPNAGSQWEVLACLCKLCPCLQFNLNFFFLKRDSVYLSTF